MSKKVLDSDGVELLWKETKALSAPFGLDQLRAVRCVLFDESSTFTVPKAVGQKFVVLAQGGGGGGFGMTNGGGGGGGGYAAISTITLPVGNIVPITIGAGGISPTVKGDIKLGGTTSFGTYVSAAGGESASGANGGSGGSGGGGGGGDGGGSGGSGGVYGGGGGCTKGAGGNGGVYGGGGGTGGSNSSGAGKGGTFGGRGGNINEPGASGKRLTNNENEIIFTLLMNCISEDGARGGANQGITGSGGSGGEGYGGGGGGGPASASGTLNGAPGCCIIAWVDEVGT